MNEFIPKDLTKVKTCKNCIYDETIPSVYFDEKGVCNYCRIIEDLISKYGTGKEDGERNLLQILDQIKRDGKSKKYDCVIGVSGGTDSSYLVTKAVEWGLRPLAVHYDNTWNTAIATENIRKVLGKLNVDLYTHVIDNKESDDIIRSFLKASVADLDCATDIALAETLYRAASKFKVKYILEGHSFVTEGISPMSALYMDGKYIKSVHKKFGKLKMKTYPNMDFTSFMKWVLIKRIKKIRPLWYINYSKEESRTFLEQEFDWKYYGGHHLENRITAFHHSYYNPIKFGIDNRNNALSASVRRGAITKEKALEIYNTKPFMEADLLAYFLKRMELSRDEFEEIMSLPPKTFQDYPNYKKRFENLRLLFFVLAKANLVPMSFYLKYCFPLQRS